MDVRQSAKNAVPRRVDLEETRRRFLLAREQCAQASTERYRVVLQMRNWPTPQRRSS
jgi:hypothetical protein